MKSSVLLLVQLSTLTAVFGCIKVNDGSFNYVHKHPKEFRVIWNIPTENCAKKFGVNITESLRNVSIETNRWNETGWHGSAITLLYKEQLGLYPHIAPNGSMINGGLPQLGNLTAHLEKAERDVTALMTADFHGLAVIDWEDWRPLWQRNYDSFSVYRVKSCEQVRARHPDWDEQRISQVAAIEFETAARSYMEQTLQRMKHMRPYAKWGFYLFPNCHNNHGEKHCKHLEQRLNNRLMWLCGASSGLYPSAYLSLFSNHTSNQNYIHGQIGESIRMANKCGNPSPIFLYSRIRYSSDDTYYEMTDMRYAVTGSKNRGLDGIVLWDDHNVARTETSCRNLQNFIKFTLGSIMKQV